MTDVVELESSMLELISRGSISAEVLTCLSREDGIFVSLESELWDYKSKIGTEKLDLAELARDIVAFYNSYGGYLIIGVEDDYSLVGCDSVEEQLIRQTIRNYTGVDIAVAVASIPFLGRNVCLISIPKRDVKNVPTPISKVGPDLTARKPIFKPGDVFFRAMDSSQLIRGADDLRFLMGDRSHSASRKPFSSGRVMANNLPDRSVIFSRFFGREEVKKDLWAWLADPMSRYRVVAGPGGFGKTSAAYSFCEEVCAESPLGIEQVVWLSAKSEQFDASANTPARLPYSRDSRKLGESYSDFESLLDAISYHFALSEEEWEGGDTSSKIRKIAEGMDIFPSLLVIDDLDSLTPDDQRLAVELAMSVGRTSSRFLFTTRKNYLAPRASTTELGGLVGEDYASYVQHLQGMYNRRLKSSELKSLIEDTEGSPLFTESVFRLLKLGSRFSEALTRWKGADGEAVRAAAFRRELEQLPWAAKRTLYAISLFESVSSAEIRQLTELEIPEVEEALRELDGLFLVQSQQIGDQARFGVAPNLRRLLHDMKVKMVPNHAEILRRAAGLRSEARSGVSRGRSKVVADAIQQAMAQMGHGAFADALATIESLVPSNPQSADLQMVYARCLAGIQPIEVAKARTAFQRSFDLGKKEPQLFKKWIEFELDNGNSNAAVDVADKGSQFMESSDWRWHERRSLAHMKRGLERERRRELLDAMTDMRTAGELLARAFRFAPPAAKSSLASAGQRLHDGIWRMASSPGVFQIGDRIELAKFAVESGDRREICLIRMVEAIEEGVRDPAFVSRRVSQLEDALTGVERFVRKRPSDRVRVRYEKVRDLFDSSISE